MAGAGTLSEPRGIVPVVRPLYSFGFVLFYFLRANVPAVCEKGSDTLEGCNSDSVARPVHSLDIKNPQSCLMQHDLGQENTSTFDEPSDRKESDITELSGGFCAPVVKEENVSICSDFCEDLKPAAEADWKLLVEPFISLLRIDAERR